MVTQEIAATVMPFGAVRKEVEAATLIAKRIVDPPVRRRLYLVYSNRRPLSASEQVFRKLLQTIITEESPKDIWLPVNRRSAN